MKFKRRQGRILRLHFSCVAPLPMGTTLRVTSSIAPPPKGDVPDGEPPVAGLSARDDASNGSTVEFAFPPSTDGEGEANEADKIHARLLQNTAEMHTSPDAYPVWRTRKPVVVVDEGEDVPGAGEGGDKGLISPTGPLLHRYRYVAVTPGAAIDWSLCSRKELGSDDDRSRGSASTGRDKATVATTPPGSEDEKSREEEGEGEKSGGEEEGRRREHRPSTPSVEDGPPVEEAEVLQYEASGQGEEPEFPPLLYENPLPPQGMAEDDDGGPEKKKRGHRRVPSLYDAEGNPVEIPGRLAHPSESAPSLAGASAASFASMTTAGGGYGSSPPMTWEGVSALPYRTRAVGGSDPSQDPSNAVVDMEIEDHWNEGGDLTFQTFWETKKKEREEEKKADSPMKGTTVIHSPSSQSPNLDDDPMDASDRPDESMFIVCYHLPVILSRDPISARWTATWSESLIAKSDLHGVSSTRRTVWIGTVSNVPAPLIKSPLEREAIRAVLEGMDCIPVFFADDGDEADTGGGGAADEAGDSIAEGSIQDLMYLGFCKQVLWPSFHNVDLLDLATNGWGQRRGSAQRGDPVAACALARAEAMERRRSRSSAVGFAPAAGAGLRSDWDQRRLDRWWNAYIHVNKKFSNIVAGLVQGGDVVWVHDYHLALMPRMLREDRGEANVVCAGRDLCRRTFVPGDKLEAAMGQMAVEDNGEQKRTARPVRMVFFIHVPFPTSQVFRELEHGEALLEGMLHADVVGFHAFDHARHFLNAAKRILGLAYESLVGGLIGVRYRGTKVLVTVSNVSVEADIIDALAEYPSVREGAASIQRRHHGRMIISGIAVAQRLSGVSYKLLAFERLLADYPVWHSRVVLLQRCLIPGARAADEADTLREVRALVQRISRRFGPEVIDYQEQVGSVLPVDQRLAIWKSSRIMMHAPIREGLNLCPLEYVYARKEPADPGAVVASEFSAVSSVLNGALRVNPYDIQKCVSTIDHALSMTLEERDARRGRDIDFVSTCPSGLWTRNVLRDLNDATLGGAKGHMAAVGESSPDSVLAREAESGLGRLDLAELERAYSLTRARVIVIDFNGTLVVTEPPGKYLKREILGTSGFKPSDVTMMALRRLCADPRNTIYVVSGDSQQNLEVAVGGMPGLGLAASNGTCFADPVGGRERSWQYLDFGVDWNAVKKVAMPIISKFTARTNGSFVKLSHSSIGWSYYSCDPEWGSLQASHLVTELGEALHSFDVRFVALKGIVEVVPRKGHKGHIVKKILEDVRARKGEVDFVLCMGDDISDEKMFTSVINFSAGSTGDESYAFNVAVGKKPTSASFYVDSASDVSDVLVTLSGDRRLHERQTSDASQASVDNFFA